MKLNLDCSDAINDLVEELKLHLEEDEESIPADEVDEYKKICLDHPKFATLQQVWAWSTKIRPMLAEASRQFGDQYKGN